MSYLRNAWYVAGWSREIEDKPVARTILDEPIVMYRTTSGEVAALVDACPHRFAPLSMGRLANDQIRCPYHGLVFDKSGACVHNPHGKGQTPSALNVGVYPITERDGIVWIWMGEATRAAEVSPPDYSFLTNAGWKTIDGYLKITANYELVTDNLLDLSHAEYLHPFIFPEGSSAGVVYKAVEEGGQISALHSMPESDVTPLFALLFSDSVKRMDGRADTHWQAPANMRIYAGAVARDSEAEDVAEMHQVHLLTPETETTTHYFWGVARDRAIDSEQLDQMLFGGISYAFENEDEPMIRAVQERMRGKPLFDLKPALLPMDEAAVRARRKLASLIAAEQQAGE